MKLGTKMPCANTNLMAQFAKWHPFFIDVIRKWGKIQKHRLSAIYIIFLSNSVFCFFRAKRKIF